MSAAAVNRQVVLAHRPGGAPTRDIFAFAEHAVPVPGDNEYVVRNYFIAMDPALVARMRPEDNYTESVNPGEVMHAYGVGEVVASNWEGAPVG
ncbi:MAG: NADP-dependent oxidoreductase, partial [Halioglobus sp.]|nr:NADP-dependent oxidoreductase [Halioglobus sp.]